MRKLLLCGLTLMLAIGANAATISGTVTNENGSPLAAMTVAAYTNAGTLVASTATPSIGTYTLTLPAGTYRVLAYDPTGAFATSFHANADSFESSTSIVLTSTQTVDFRLARAGHITGRVLSATEAALPKITVAVYNLSGTRRGFTTTDSAGAFTLSVPAGTYKVAAYDDTFAYATTFFENATSLAAAKELVVIATQSTTANLHLPAAAKITGTITDRATLAPLAGMRATAYASDGTIAAQALTGSDGKYAMAARGGALRVVVDDPNGNYATTYVPDAESFSTEAAVNATAGETLTIGASMARAGRFAGKVTDRVTGAPLANITAAAYNADGTTRAFAKTDAAGAYSIVVPPGDFRVGVFDAALVYLPQFHPNQTAFESAAPQHAIAQQSIGAIDFALTRGARISTHVSARTSGASLPGMTVGAYDLFGRLIASAVTDGSGNGLLFLAPAVVKLLAFDPTLQYATGYSFDAASFDTTPSLSLLEGQSLDASLTLPEAGRIRGTVASATTSAPLPGIAVIVYDAQFRTITTATTDAAGAFRVAVPAGTYIVAAADPSHRYATLLYPSAPTLTVSAGHDLGPLDLRLSLAPVPPRRRVARH